MIIRKLLSVGLILTSIFFGCSGDSSNPVSESNTLPPGTKPITDMNQSEFYKGMDGGLYGQWSNEVPEDHRIAAIGELATIQPLDSLGNPSPDGKIVMVSIGMSNTNGAFDAFTEISESDPDLSPELVFVNGARPGNDAIDWATDIKNSWENVDVKLAQNNVYPLQVQVAWLYLAYRNPLEAFPVSAEKLKGYIKTILNTLKDKYPNVKIAYLTSREYAGYSEPGASNPEPFAYESVFANRWLIEEQINGDPDLNYNPAFGEIKAPLLLWGPYTWANGTTPRNDGLFWTRDDFSADGMHPSEQGYQKLGQLMHDFFKFNELSSSWFNK